MLYINENVFVCMIIFDNRSITSYSETTFQTFEFHFRIFVCGYRDASDICIYTYMFQSICFSFWRYVYFSYACIHVKKCVCVGHLRVYCFSSQLSALAYISHILLISPCAQYSILQERKKGIERNEKLGKLEEKHVKINIEKRIKAASETKRKKETLQYTFADKSNCISHTSIFIERSTFHNDSNSNDDPDFTFNR